MKRTLVGLVAVTSLLVAGHSAGQDEVKPYPPRSSDRLQYLGVLGAYTLADEDRAGIDYAAGASVLFGTQFSSGIGYEVHLFHDTFETDTDGFTDFYRPALGFDATWSFGDRESFTPFALLGAGGAYNDVAPDAEDEFGWFGNFGGGFVTGPLYKNLALRGELRALYDDFQDGFFDWRFGLGLSIPLAESGEKAWEPIEKVRVVEVTRETGLYDSDGDGVVDGSDQCPDTPAGTRVGGDGCTLPEVVALRGVTFEFDQAVLTANAKTVLDELVVPLMNRYPDMVVEVAGHTDSKGSDRYNQTLSEHRAKSVVEYLVSHDIDRERMTARGYGESEPVADNATDEGRELNRRVELRVKN